VIDLSDNVPTASRNVSSNEDETQGESKGCLTLDALKGRQLSDVD